ncbi:hypothetical protein [Entomomonas asaccharolytica]|uniref:Uncharacterized protein n=1 Tax=Entomomonas asaccharolytica TaxID=2785331 RepID=A0A974RVU1_9GAMM|nr:hypothetical protein [Entomomonas asaccharolytica]QQP84531.1 hypothetical protein JHT90_08885 [Entomomonas asaccharolytica]
MANNQQTTHNTPLYKNADFTCGRCDSLWQATYIDIAALRANQPIACKSCNCELIMSDEELQTLNQRFAQSEKLSKRAIYFTLPYFVLCAVIGFIYGGMATTVMIVIGFMVIITMRKSLMKDGIDHFHLIALKKEPTNQTQAKNQNKPSFKKKKKKSK